jgi:drug/metabolite transporter (DMT)-like permease
MLARFYLLAAVIIWGWTFVATKVCLQFLSPAELLAARFLMALPLLWIIMRSRGYKLQMAKEHRVMAWVSAAIFGIHFLLQTMGLMYTSATNSAWIVAISPLVMAIMAWLILREKLRPATWIGIVVAFGGLMLLVSAGQTGKLGFGANVGDWLTLGSAFTWSLYTVTTRDLSRAYPPMVVTVAMLIPATVLLNVYMAATSPPGIFLTLSTEAYIALAFLGFVGMGMAHWFWLEGVARVGVARAAVFLYLEPLATTALAVPYLGEPFGMWSAIGGMLVLAGVFYASRRGKPG